MQSNQPKKLRAIVKAIISTEAVQLLGLNKSKSGQPLIKKLFLIGIQGPKCATAADEIEKEEALGFEAREFLRKQLVGKQVSFFVEQKIGDREFGHIELDDQDISANLILKNGYGQINENQLQQFSQKNQIYKPVNYDAYVKALQKAKADKVGYWADGANKKIRQFKSVGSNEEVLEKYGKTTMTAVIESVQHKFIVVYINELNNFLKVTPLHVQLPSQDWKEYKNFVEEHLQQKDVKITQMKEDLGCFAAEIISDGFDLKLTLLKEGFGKLDMNCINDVDMNRFKQLQEAFDAAQAQKLRIWKDITEEKKASKKIQGSGYVAKVVEVHSGESITVEQQGKEPIRLFLANIKAPAMGNPVRGESDKPWAFESREYLRKLIIGRNVTVEPEFTKTFVQQVEESKEERTKTFATIFFGDQNVSTSLIENGFAQVSMPRAGEDFSKYLKQLKDVEEVAKNSKKGIFNLELVKAVPKYNDLTLQKNQKNTKAYFEFLKDEKNIQGMVDLVLNGSRFKIRLDKQNTYIILLLEGVRCLPNDQNVKEFAFYSNEAMKYSKANIFQRDIEFEVTSVDQKGTFHGTIMYNKKNYAAELLEQGLAQCFSTKSHKYSALYHELQTKAQQQKKGMWKENISQMMGQGNQNEGIKKISETKTMNVAEIISAQEFFLQDTKNKSLSVIEETLKQFTHKSEQPLANPIKKGTPCVALWDGVWYRAKIINDKPKGQDYQVHFIDYGNTDYVNVQDIRKIPAKLNQFEPCVVKCGLAYLTTPSLDHPCGEDAATKLKDWIWGQQLKAQLVYISQGKTFVVLYIGDKKISVNEVMLFDGYAKISRDLELPKEYLEWVKQSDIAEEKKKGIWNYDDEEDYNEDY